DIARPGVGTLVLQSVAETPRQIRLERMVEGIAVPTVGVNRRKSRIDSWRAAGEEVTCIIRSAVVGPAGWSKHVQSRVVLQMLATGAHIGHTGRCPADDFTL